MVQEVVMYKSLGGAVCETKRQAVEGDVVYHMCQSEAINQASAQKFVECLRTNAEYRASVMETLQELMDEYAPLVSEG